VAFTGHKSLFGPTGIGGLVLSRGFDVQTTRFGGTGIESQDPVHTQTYPHRLEAGTINFMGILGLMAGMDYLDSQGMEAIAQNEGTLARRLWQGLAQIPRVKLYGTDRLDQRLAVILANVEGMTPADVAAILDGDFGIATRSGLQCAPLVHQRLGTGKAGGVRFSLGPFNTSEDIDLVLEAMGKICTGK